MRGAMTSFRLALAIACAIVNLRPLCVTARSLLQANQDPNRGTWVVVDAEKPNVNAITAYFCNLTGDPRMPPHGAYFPLTVRVPVGVTSTVVFANITGTIPGTNPPGYIATNGLGISFVSANPGDVQDWRGGSSVVQQPGAAVIQQPGTSVQPSQFPCEGCDMPMPQPVPPCHKCHGPFCKHKCKKPMKPPQQPPTVVTQPGTAVIQQPGTSVVQQPGSKIPGGSGGGGQPGQPGTGVVQPGTSVVQQPGTSVVQQPGGGIPGASGGGAQPGQPGSGGQPGQAGGGVVQPGTGVVQPGTGVVQPGAGVVQQPGRKLSQAPAPIEFISNNGSLGQPALNVYDTVEGVPHISFTPTNLGQTAIFQGALQVAVTESGDGFGMPYIPYQIAPALSPNCKLTVKFEAV